ncbi:MAG: ABC transporter substrate-binding protein [Gemmatimonadota bacterium]
MKRFPPFLFFLALSLNGCASESADGVDVSLADAFCGPVMARVDSFMVTFAGQEPAGDRYGGMVVVGSLGDVSGMGPADAQSVEAAQHQQFLNLMTLIEFDENLEPAPYLATSWEISEDQTELTFHLRDDVYWHDGELTTAQDVAFTYLTVIKPESQYPNPGFFQAYLPGEEGVEVVDSFTVKFRFQPHADILETWRNLSILPHHLLGDVPTSELVLHPYGGVCPVGNGPFRFAARTPGDSWTFEANPAFPLALGGRPYLDRYVYRVIPSQTTLMAELLTGGVDVYVQMLPNHAVTAREEPTLAVPTFPYPSIFFVAWNSRVPELADARVRRALTLGINRQQLIDGIQLGEAVLLNSGLPPVHWAYDPTLGDSLGYDPDRARSLLEAAGWVDRDGDGIRENGGGEPLQVDLVYNQNQERQQVTEVMRVQLQDIGVDLRPSVLERGTYGAVITSPERDFEGALVTFETGFRIDDRDLFHSERVDGIYGFSGTMDPELDRYLDTLQLIPNREEALPVWAAYQHRLLEVQPYTFLYSTLRRNGVNRRLQDVVMDTRGDLASIRHWWIDPQGRRAP